jgi:hypothetical protein
MGAANHGQAVNARTGTLGPTYGMIRGSNEPGASERCFMASGAAALIHIG